MARSHLKVYFSFDEDTACLTDAERGRLLLAMVRYAKDGTEPSLTGNERFLWPVVRGQIDRDIDAYDSHIESGKRGGRPKNNLVISENQTKPNETKQNQTKPNETKQNQTKPNETKIEEKDKEEDKDKDNDKGVSARFAPPTLEEVTEFCRVRGNKVDPVKFYAFYESKGWMVGKNKMKSWRAAVVTWERDDGGGAASGPGPRRTVAAQQYSQRDYSGEDEEAMDRMIREMGG